MLHDKCIAVDGKRFVFEEDLRDGVTVDLKVEVAMCRVHGVRSGFERIYAHFEINSLWFGCVGKYGCAIGISMCLQVLLSSLHADVNVRHTLPVLSHDPDAKPAGFTFLAAEKNERFGPFACTVQDDRVAVALPRTLREVISSSVSQHILKRAVGLEQQLRADL